jgi:transcription antitermination factor NusG
MTDQQDPLDHIQQLLESKSSAKQITYKNLLSSFDLLAKESKRIITELKKRVKPGDEDVTVDFKLINEHEFHVKLAGDLLVFVLHTNVVTFADEHPLMKSDYINEKEINRYFGQIMIYNFMSDSIKFNRMNDPGYLLARILINHENRFLVEGEGPLGFLYNVISPVPISESDVNAMVKQALKIAIENDLMAPPFPDVRFITVYQKNEKTQELGAGQKIGFKMSYQSSTNS